MGRPRKIDRPALTRANFRLKCGNCLETLGMHMKYACSDGSGRSFIRSRRPRDKVVGYLAKYLEVAK